MECPGTCYRLLWVCFECGTQGPHDPLLPGGPMSCQSTPATYRYACLSLGKDTGAP
ncbi:unnamed protein product [Staurois parvus]|uniref:Uncharacterized protein n=1 Tax=Staurois parvus TaxID=386267 RepID=A0ABN9DJ88_9NEOB|nr:unnamed protein product [Staurois parvus]